MKKFQNSITCIVLFLAFLMMITGCGGDGSGASNTASQPTTPVNTLTAEGKVIDRDSGAAIANAKIVYPDKKEVACGSDGSFKIEVPEGKGDTFVVEAENYKPTLVSVQLKAAKSDVEIPMVPTENDEVPLVISVYDKETKMPGNQAKTAQ